MTPSDESTSQELLRLVRESAKSGKWTARAAWVVSGVAICAIAYAGSSVNTDLTRTLAQIETQRQQITALRIANIRLLKWAASDNPDPESKQLLKDIQHDLETFNAKSHLNPGNPSR